MNPTLDDVLCRALAASERANSHLNAPNVRATIARKRVIRRATIGTVATAGAVGLGAGSYAVAASIIDREGPGIGAASVTPSVEGTPTTSATLSSEPTPSPSPSASDAPTASAQSTPSPAATPGDKTPSYGSQEAFCQDVPLMKAQADASGVSASDIRVGASGAPNSGVTCTMPEGFSAISYSWSPTNPEVTVTSKCVDNAGTPTFGQYPPAQPGTFQSRWVDACMGGIHMYAYEAIDSGDFVLTDEEFQEWAVASVPMSSAAAEFAP